MGSGKRDTSQSSFIVATSPPPSNSVQLTVTTGVPFLSGGTRSEPHVACATYPKTISVPDASRPAMTATRRTRTFIGDTP